MKFYILKTNKIIAGVMFMLFLAVNYTYADSKDFERNIYQPDYGSQIDKYVSGKVVDPKGNPVIAATIIINNTSDGTITDMEGYFVLKANVGDVLEVSCVGYETITYTITKIDCVITLKEKDLEIEDVVVTGYGNVNRKSFAGSSSVVDTEKVKDTPTVSIENRLAGSVSGITITSSNGLAGSMPSIRIRGMGSINADNEPLYVIDGVVALSGNCGNIDYSAGGTSVMSTINPNDIASISVIKDAAAASLYGSRAANGVIVITTKTGSAGKTKFNFSSSCGISNFATEYRETLDGESRKEVLYLGLYNYGVYKADMTESEATAFADSKIGEYATEPWSGWTNWDDYLFQTAVSQNYELSISGGDINTRFYSSVSYVNQQGVVEITDYERFTGSLNLSHRTGKLTFDFSTKLASSLKELCLESTYYINPILQAACFFSPSDYPYNEDGSVNITNGFINASSPLNNPALAYEQAAAYNRVKRALINTSVKLDLTENLYIKETVSYDYLISNDDDWSSSLTDTGATCDGARMIVNSTAKKFNSQTMINYNRVFGDNHNHVFSALGAYELEDYRCDYYALYGYYFPDDTKNEICNAAETSSSSSYSEFAMISFVAKTDYTFDDRLYFGASFRRDGSTSLSPDTRWGNFWSMSSYWKISNERWFKDSNLSDIFSDAKVRASYGVNGTQPSGNLSWLGYYSLSNTYNGSSASYEVQLDNDQLTWEKNYATNIGIDFTAFSKLNVVIDLYNRDTKDLILEAPVSPISGYSSYLSNVGAMNNKGIDLEISYDAIRKKDFSLNLGFNISKNKNTLVSLNSGVSEMYDSYSSYMLYKVGSSFYSYSLYEVAGVDALTGLQLYYVNETDENGNIINPSATTTDITEANKKIFSNVSPTVTGGITGNMSWKNIDMNFTMSYSLGGHCYDGLSWLYGSGTTSVYYGQVPAFYDIDDMWSGPGDTSATLPAFTYGNTVSFSASDRLYSTDHLRLKNFVVGYNFTPEKISKLGLNKLRVYVSANNLFTIKDKDIPFDPEVPVNGVVWASTPAMRTIVAGVDISF